MPNEKAMQTAYDTVITLADDSYESFCNNNTSGMDMYFFGRATAYELVAEYLIALSAAHGIDIIRRESRRQEERKRDLMEELTSQAKEKELV